MTKRFKLTNTILGWALGILASIIYIVTSEPTASWWDCGEYIATTYKLLIGHPPGAPTFQIIGHFFTLFAGDVTNVAFSVNVMSAICSGLTIMFLFWTITLIGRKLINNLGGMTSGREIALLGSALVGALTYTFTDSFWFSAVEGEVYAMSSFFTALVFWCILKWDYEIENPVSNANPHRWIVLIIYLVGLSIGVHLLNLLTLPAIGLVIYFRLSEKASYMGVVLSLAIISFFVAIFFTVPMMLAIWAFITLPLIIICAKKKTFSSKADWGVFLSLAVSFVVLGTILFGIIPGTVSMIGKFEIFFVNTFGLPFNTGVIIFFLLLIALIGYAFYYGFKKDKKIFLVGVFSFCFLLVGYSTFFTLVIRSNANPTIDENNPENAVSLLSYLNREQYGSKPLIHGQSYNSRLIAFEDGKPVYTKDEVKKRYVITDHRKGMEYQYLQEDLILFPRMWNANRAEHYTAWLKNQYDPNNTSDKEALRHIERNKVPTHSINMKYFQTFQLNYMYFRYFMWNFSGRQNDLQGSGDLHNGNWITGIPVIDNVLVGNQSDLPASMQRPGNNKYYMLPLLLGLIGIFFLSSKDPKNSFIVLMLFIMTGVAIVFYLNDYVFQPRERDYAYAASFYAFAIWVGFGVFGIYSLFEKIKNNKAQVAGAIFTTLICIGLVPCIMANQNWDDHDRSNRYTALAIAKNYLDSCEPNAILFTMGDNDTFPLWYAQEVEGYRTDVRVCNLSLLSGAWYVDQMKQKAYQSEPLPFSMTKEQYREGSREVISMAPGNNEFLNLKDVVEYIKSPQFDNVRQIRLDSRSNVRAIPASFSMPVDKEKVLANGTVKPELDSLIVDRVTWNARLTDNAYITRAFLVMMDILAHNNWERPIYYATTTGADAFFGLEEYFQLEGLAYRLVPVKNPQRRGGMDDGRIDTEILYDKLVNLFNDHSRVDRVNNPNTPEKEPYPYLWGGYNDPRVYQNEDNLRLVSMYRRQFSRLAGAFHAEGDLKRAEEVLDHGNRVFPDEIFPYKVTYSYSQTMVNIQYLEQYLKLNTPAGTQKGLAMAERIIDYLIEDFAWLENSNDRTIKIQSENISNNFIFLHQLTITLGEDYVKQLDAKLKQIKLDKSIGVLLEKQQASFSNKLKKVDANLYTIFEDLRDLKGLYLRAAILTGNDAAAQRIIQTIDQQMAIIENANPQLAASMKEALDNVQY